MCGVRSIAGCSCMEVKIMKAQLINRLPLIAYVFMVLLTGLNPIAVRYTVLELPPFWGATLRFVPAALLLFILAAFLRLPMPKGRELLGAVIYGGLQFGASFAFLYWGLEKVQPGMASVILALGPLFALLFAILHRLETFRWRALFGALIAVAGVGLVFREQLNAKVPILSMLAVVVGSMCLNESFVIIKKFPRANPITTSAIGMGTGSVILMGMTLIWHEKLLLPVKTATWGALIYSILLGSCVVFMLLLYVLKRMAASTISYQFVLMPFVTLTVSTLLTHEVLSPVLIGGAALVLTGVYFGGIYSPKKRSSIQPAPVIVPREPSQPVISREAAPVEATSDC